ncbi:MAG: hypothetical protein ACLTSX_00395 [Collinsella sp.]
MRAVHFPRLMDGGRNSLVVGSHMTSCCTCSSRCACETTATFWASRPLRTEWARASRAMREALPFALSDEQETAVCEILGDMARMRERVMNRLLLGDVGHGQDRRSPASRCRPWPIRAIRRALWRPPASSRVNMPSRAGLSRCRRDIVGTAYRLDGRHARARPCC